MEENQQVFVILTGIACLILASRYFLEKQTQFQEVRINKIEILNLNVELPTPVSFVETSEPTRIQQETSKSIKVSVSREAKALRQLVNTTLDLSKILHGEIQPKWINFNDKMYKNFINTSTTGPTITPTKWWQHSTVPITETFYEPEYPGNKFPEYGRCPLDLLDGYTDSEIYQKSQNIQPTYNLNRDQFLINLSPFGPNNQFRGFRSEL